MSLNLTPEDEGVPMTKNSRGYMVPSDLSAHLQFWLNSIVTMEVASPPPETVMFCNSCLTHETTSDPVPAEIRDSFLVKVLEGRLARLGLVATPWLVVFISGICKSPGQAVMWAFFMKMAAIPKKTNQVGILELMELFPKGLPTDIGMEWMWDLQKIAFKNSFDSNLLDLVTMRKL